jgi:hypothetical protein
MKHTITLVASTLLLGACSYNPVIDTAGRSGTFPNAKAVEITNDIQHCKKLASETVNPVLDEVQNAFNLYVSMGTLGIVPRRTKDYDQVVKNCLTNRGHSVVK